MKHDVKCSVCGKPITVGNTTYHRNIKANKPFYCPECLSKLRAENTKRRMNSMTEEEMKAHTEKRLRAIANKTQEERDATYKKISNSLRNRSEDEISEWKENIRSGLNNRSDEAKQIARDKRAETYANKTDEELQAIGNRISQTKNAKSQEEKDAIVQKQIETKANRTQEQKDASLQKFHDTMAKKSEEEKRETKMKMSDAQKQRWGRLSDEEKAEQMSPLVDAGKLYWLEADKEDHIRHGEKISETWAKKPIEDHIRHGEKISETWFNTPEDVRRDKIARTYSTARKGTSQFSETFENRFNDLYEGRYQLSKEYKVELNGQYHSWDYAISYNGELDTLVDLDGAYYHNDGEYEYDGIHGFANIGDARRSLFIPDGVKHAIIMEQNFDNTFMGVCRQIGTPYEDFVSGLYRKLRMQPFPYPSYSDKEMLRSLFNIKKATDLALWNSEFGMHLVYHCYHSIWHDHIRSKMCPHDAYMNDDILMGMVRSHMILNPDNKNKITQCFLLSDVAPRVPIFTPIMGTKILHRYCQEYDSIIDCNTCYGGIMLPAITIGKKYIGYDPNPAHYNESNQLIQLIQKFGLPVDARMESHISGGPCVCSYIPFGDDYITAVMNKFVCSRGVFVVPNTNRYRDCIVEEIPINDHFGKRSWYVLVMQK